MPKNKLNTKDIEHLKKEHQNMLLDEDRLDEGGYEDVMTSAGYVALWTDGEVTNSDGLLGWFDEDGDWTLNGVGEGEE